MPRNNDVRKVLLNHELLFMVVRILMLNEGGCGLRGKEKVWKAS